jgi:hypothetical protein
MMDGLKMAEKDTNRGDIVSAAYCSNNYEGINWNSIYDAVEDDVLRKQEEKRRFTKPSRMDVCEYMAEKHVNDYETESEKFVDFYSSKGWFVGKNKMKDWRAAVRNWIRGLKTNQFNPGLLKPIHNHSESDSNWSK